MKIKDKNIQKSVENITDEYRKTLTKAIVDLMKLTGCGSHQYFCFGKPVVITSAHTWGENGIKINGDFVVVNGLFYVEDNNEISFLIAAYDCEPVLSSFKWHPEDYQLIYKSVLKAVKAY